MTSKEESKFSIGLPSASFQLAPSITLQPPLSRLGHGPGLIIIVPPLPPQESTSEHLPPLQKWTEEGFAVVEIKNNAFEGQETVEEVLKFAADGLEKCEGCDGGVRGLVVYGSTIWDKIAPLVSSNPNIAAVVIYGSTSSPALATPTITTPLIYHLAGKPEDSSSSMPKSSDGKTVYTYPKVTSSLFALPGHIDFHSPSESISYTRNLTFLKKHIGGPYFDLEAIWEEHTYYEFVERDVEKTMGTMVAEPYVNHIPTMTGGIGRERLSNFYRHHFVFSNPADTELELVSRTVGIDRVIDEFVFSFTHDKTIDWLLPGIPPTNLPVRVPFTSVVNIRGDRLYHEHIAWDQASILVQLGLLPEYLPFPYALPDGRKPEEGKRFEYRVPAAGAETARKILDERSVTSNEMFGFGIREVGT